MSDQFAGTWTCIQSENLEAYLKEVGAKQNIRKLTSHVRSTLSLELEGDEWTMTFVSPQKTHHAKFKLGQDFEGIAFDGRMVITKFELDGANLIQTDTAVGYGKNSKIEGTVNGNTLTCEECNGVKAISVYEKTEPVRDPRIPKSRSKSPMGSKRHIQHEVTERMPLRSALAQQSCSSLHRDQI